jgi:hypothetical protein
MTGPEPRSQRHGGKSYRMTRVRLWIGEWLNSAPRLKKAAQRTWRGLKWRTLRARQHLTVLHNVVRGYHTRLIDIEKTHVISPTAVEFCALEEFNVEHFKGRVLGGDWDLLKKRFTDLDICVAFSEVLSQRRTWEETVFFARIADELDQGHVHWRCRTRQELSARCLQIEQLYERIKRDGYQSQAELAGHRTGLRPWMLDDEITVSIGRNGDLLFSNSAHRLCIAKLLKLDRVPVKVAVRHPEWIEHVKRSGKPEVLGARTS